MIEPENRPHDSLTRVRNEMETYLAEQVDGMERAVVERAVVEDWMTRIDTLRGLLKKQLEEIMEDSVGGMRTLLNALDDYNQAVAVAAEFLPENGPKTLEVLRLVRSASDGVETYLRECDNSGTTTH